MAKRCTGCFEWKDSSEFYRDRTKLDGLKSQCKDCRREYKREYRARQRAARRVRLKREIKTIWQPERNCVQNQRKSIVESVGFKRWKAKREARRKALMARHIRRWHVHNTDASQQWAAENGEAIRTYRQRDRADEAGAAINDLRPDEWKWLVNVYDQRCAYCGAHHDHLTPDHVVPLARGGNNTLSNIVPACGVCNQRKGARTPNGAGMGFAVKVDVIKQLEQQALL